MRMIEKLDGIRERVLSLPADHKLRIRYRDLRRGIANAREEAEYGGNSSLLTGTSTHEANIDKLVSDVEKYFEVKQ